MANPQKAKGSKAEREVLAYLEANGVPVERIPAGATLDRGDLWVPMPNWPSIDVKDHQRTALAEWVTRAGEQARHAKRIAGVVWHKRAGTTNPGRWYVTMSGEAFLALMGVSK